MEGRVNAGYLQFLRSLVSLLRMITFLSGRLAEALPTQIVVDVHGVGYQVDIPLSSYDALPAPGNEIRIHTHFHVREDIQQLFGFMTLEERDLFRLLLNHVSGIGPRLALAVLSGMSVRQFKAAVVEKDSQTLARTKGLGKKTAERIILELRDRVGVADAWEAAAEAAAGGTDQGHWQDAVLALISLGYKQVEAHKAVKQAAEGGCPPVTEELVRQALKRLA